MRVSLFLKLDRSYRLQCDCIVVIVVSEHCVCVLNLHITCVGNSKNLVYVGADSQLSLRKAQAVKRRRDAGLGFP